MVDRDEPTPGRSSPPRSGWRWVGPALGLLVGMVYGYAWWHAIDLVYYDPWQPSPGMAAFVPFALGGMLALVVLPVVVVIICWLVRGKTDVGCGFCVVLLVVTMVGVILGSALEASLVSSTRDPGEHDGRRDVPCHPLLRDC